jgi:homoserine dehydrogenase
MTLQADSRALARYEQLIRRAAFDLKLAHDAAVAAGTPFARLAKIKRARSEMRDLMREPPAQEEHAPGARKLSR